MIGHGNACDARDMVYPNLDRSACSKFGSITQQVKHDLIDTLWIPAAADGLVCGYEYSASCALDLGREALYDGLHQRGQFCLFGLQHQETIGDSGYVQKIVNEQSEPFTLTCGKTHQVERSLIAE